MATVSVALQLYTVRDESARDFAGTLRRVAQIGYAAVEFAGYGGLAADEMRELLDEMGLQAALPFVDDFLPAHNLANLEALGALLLETAGRRPVRRQTPVAATA